MRHRRGPAVVGALLCAALATAGCGLGPGADIGDVQVTVTREYGAVPVLDTSVAAKESDTVMRALEGVADIETRYGGGFVHSIDGVAEGQHDGDPYDWFYYLDGVEWPVGAAETDLQGGERIWWDYRNWGTVNHIPAVVGSWPAPFSDGIPGLPSQVVVRCLEPRGSFRANRDRKEPRNCEMTREALQREGAKVVDVPTEDSVFVLVGPWERIRRDPTAHLIEAGPAESGVFAEFHGSELAVLDEGGEVVETLGPDAGLVAATSRYGGLPVWVVTGGTTAGARAAAEALDAEHLRNHYAVAVEGKKTTPLPLGAR
jgi:hypothetical protein